MTIGIYIQWGAVPVLMADVLLTGGKPSTGQLTGWEADPSQYLYRLRDALAATGAAFGGTVRKMVDVRSGVAFCWAGREVEAAVFNREFAAFMARGIPLHHEISRWFEAYPTADCQELEVIALVRSDRGAQPYFLNTAPFELSCGRRVAIIGEGRPAVFNVLDSLCGEDLKKPYSEARLTGILAILFFLHGEQGAGAAARWGGGFEMRADVGLGPERVTHLQVSNHIFSDSTRTVRTSSSFISFYLGEMACFLINSSWSTAKPFNHSSPSVNNYTINSNARESVVGFRFDDEQEISWFNADTSQFPIIGSITGQPPVFLHKTEVLQEMVDRFRKLRRKRWRRYLRAIEPLPKGA